MSKFRQHGKRDRHLPRITRGGDNVLANWNDVVDEPSTNVTAPFNVGDLVVSRHHFVKDTQVSTTDDTLYTLRRIDKSSPEYKPGAPNVEGYAHGIYLGMMYIQCKPVNVHVGKGWHGQHKFKMLNVNEPIFQFGDIRVIAQFDQMEQA